MKAAKFKSYISREGYFCNAGMNAYPELVDIDFKELAESTHTVLSDLDHKGDKGIMLVEFREGTKGRKTDNIISHTGIGVDIDSGASETLLEQLKQTVYELWIYTTCTSTKEHLKLRVMCPLSEPVSNEEYPYAVEQFCKTVGIEEYDKCSLKKNQILYLPECLADNKDDIINVYIEGKPYSYIQEEHTTEPEKKQTVCNEKPDLIQAFCNNITAEEVLDQYLDNRYEYISGNKYRLIGSVCPPGVYILDDGCAYSHHSTDTMFIGKDGKRHKLNSFDLFCKAVGKEYPADRQDIELIIKDRFPSVWNDFICLKLFA